MVDKNYFCELILQSGNNIQAAAKQMGISRAWFYDTRKLTSCNVDQLEKLADLLNISTDSLLQRKPAPSASAIASAEKDIILLQINMLKKLLSEKESMLKEYSDTRKEKNNNKLEETK